MILILLVSGRGLKQIDHRNAPQCGAVLVLTGHNEYRLFSVLRLPAKSVSGISGLAGPQFIGRIETTF